MYFIFQKGWCSYTNISDQREHLPSPGPQHSPIPDAYRSVGAGEAHRVFSPDYNLQKSAVLWPRASTAVSSFFFISTSFRKSTAPGSEDPRSAAARRVNFSMVPPSQSGVRLQGLEKTKDCSLLTSPDLCGWPVSYSPLLSSPCWRSIVYLGNKKKNNPDNIVHDDISSWWLTHYWSL